MASLIIYIKSLLIFFFRKYTLSGSYRKIFQIPQHLNWKIIHYNSKNQDLILSDMDELRDFEPIKDNPGMLLNKKKKPDFRHSLRKNS